MSQDLGTRARTGHFLCAHVVQFQCAAVRKEGLSSKDASTGSVRMMNLLYKRKALSRSIREWVPGSQVMNSAPLRNPDSLIIHRRP